MSLNKQITTSINLSGRYQAITFLPISYIVFVIWQNKIEKVKIINFMISAKDNEFIYYLEKENEPGNCFSLEANKVFDTKEDLIKNL